MSAENYSTDNEFNPINGHYERPAMIDFAGDVDGRRILSGTDPDRCSRRCAPRERVVTEFDANPAMVALAAAAW